MFSRFLSLNLIRGRIAFGITPAICRCLSNTQIQDSTRFSPVISSWIYKENHIIKTPTVSSKIDLPAILPWISPLKEPPKVINEIIAPIISNNTPKEAVRLIVIRRKKMRKHKLRKLRKRMKFEWAKLRQRREFKKEKVFQAVLTHQCSEAEAFSAEEYVEKKLNKLHETVIPRYWKGKRLPKFLILQKMGLPSK